MFKNPIIGISASLLTIENGCFAGRERSYVGQDYIQAVQQAGGIPIILPILADKQSIRQQVELIDGLVLSGGYDVHPSFYGEEPDLLLEETCPPRDEYEISLVQFADQMTKPIFGVCRGLQLLNVAYGGTLYQDVSYHSSSLFNHAQKTLVGASLHDVDVVDGTLLRNVLGASSIQTNSFHHQAIKHLAPSLKVNATARDGVIEGVEKNGPTFVIGLQCHPELMFEKHPEIFKLFQSFVAHARDRRFYESR